MTKNKCPKSGKKWNNEHVQHITVDNEHIHYECIKCGLKQHEPKSELTRILLRAILK